MVGNFTQLTEQLKLSEFVQSQTAQIESHEIVQLSTAQLTMSSIPQVLLLTTERKLNIASTAP